MHRAETPIGFKASKAVKRVPVFLPLAERPPPIPACLSDLEHTQEELAHSFGFSTKPLVRHDVIQVIQFNAHDFVIWHRHTMAKLLMPEELDSAELLLAKFSCPQKPVEQLPG